jgi:hypothetical protein
MAISDFRQKSGSIGDVYWTKSWVPRERSSERKKGQTDLIFSHFKGYKISCLVFHIQTTEVPISERPAERSVWVLQGSLEQEPRIGVSVRLLGRRQEAVSLND